LAERFTEGYDVAGPLDTCLEVTLTPAEQELRAGPVHGDMANKDRAWYMGAGTIQRIGSDLVLAGL
jgi:hypothetical protein